MELDADADEEMGRVISAGPYSVSYASKISGDDV